jgi:DNA polymerase-3 subunit epsilon
MLLQLSRPLAFFDLETTGLTIGMDRIIEISVLKINKDGSKEYFTRRINPEMPISAKASEITGIKDEDLKHEKTFAEVAPELNAFLDQCDLAGYNSNKFDVPFLVDEFLRVGVDFRFEDRKLVDVQNIFHKMEPRTLEAAYRFYCNEELKHAHSAEGDITATFEVFEAQMKKYGDKIGTSVEALHKFTNMFNTVDLAGRLVYNEQGEEIVNFGKHKGKKVEDVFNSEPSYYDWLMRGDFSRQTKAVFKKLKELNDKKRGKTQPQAPDAHSINLLREKFNKH